ncbi:MAG: SAM-dependent methyltransferase [Bacteroidales bacterium]
MPGKIYLIPNSLGSQDPDTFLPVKLKGLITGLKFLVVENARNARRYLKMIDHSVIINEVTFYELNKHTDPGEVHTFLQPVLDGHDLGIISEAGLPGIADPGSELVNLAHRKQIRVIPLTGPSSIFLALMASGLNGQAFRFAGYLPVQKNERIQSIKKLEKRVLDRNETQIFIETPYRNNAILDDICAACHDQTLLTVAVDISTKTESIKTAEIKIWKKNKPDLHKRPAVFLLGKS